MKNDSDRYGTFITLTLAEGVETKLRWIPPGKQLLEAQISRLQAALCKLTLQEGKDTTL